MPAFAPSVCSSILSPAVCRKNDANTARHALFALLGSCKRCFCRDQFARKWSCLLRTAATPRCLLSVRGDRLSPGQAVYSVRHPVSGSSSLKSIQDVKQQKSSTHFYSSMITLRNTEWQSLRMLTVLQSAGWENEPSGPINLDPKDPKFKITGWFF